MRRKNSKNKGKTMEGETRRKTRDGEEKKGRKGEKGSRGTILLNVILPLRTRR